MTKAVIFDLDGTLIQTEVLKASSYAKAVNLLTNNQVSEAKVLEVFEKYVGLSRVKVLAGLYSEFSNELQQGLQDTDAEKIKDTLIAKRLEIYRDILDHEEILSSHFCQKTLGLFHRFHNEGFRLVLATMSHRFEASKVLKMMKIEDKFELILTRDDVQEGKPNPEIYLKAQELLQLSKEECLIMEDSINGIKAAINAGIPVFAITNSVTKKSVNKANVLDDAYIINDMIDFEKRIFQHINSNV